MLTIVLLLMLMSQLLQMMAVFYKNKFLFLNFCHILKVSEAQGKQKRAKSVHLNLLKLNVNVFNCLICDVIMLEYYCRTSVVTIGLTPLQISALSVQ